MFGGSTSLPRFSSHGDWARSVQLVRRSRPFLLLPFISCLSSLSLCLTVSLSLSLSVSLLFKALLYSFHSLSIALQANSQSQWAWITQDKYNITQCTQTSHIQMHVWMHAWWVKHIFIHPLSLVYLDLQISLSILTMKSQNAIQATRSVHTWTNTLDSVEVILT